MGTFRVVAWLPSTHILSWHEIGRTVCFFVIRKDLGFLLGAFFEKKKRAMQFGSNILAFLLGALGEISLPCSENVVRALLKYCYGLPYDANLGLEDELVSWIDGGIIYELLFLN